VAGEEQQDMAFAGIERDVRQAAERLALMQAAKALLGRASWHTPLLRLAGRVCLKEARRT
jgi:hypothetical protein